MEPDPLWPVSGPLNERFWIYQRAALLHAVPVQFMKLQTSVQKRLFQRSSITLSFITTVYIECLFNLLLQYYEFINISFRKYMIRRLEKFLSTFLQNQIFIIQQLFKVNDFELITIKTSLFLRIGHFKKKLHLLVRIFFWKWFYIMVIDMYDTQK